MQQEPTITDLAARLILAETRIADLERRLSDQATIDHALLRRVDDTQEIVKKIQKDQARGFETLTATLAGYQKETSTNFDGLEAGIGALVETAKDHKANIETIADGQAKIIALLTGGKKTTND